MKNDLLKKLLSAIILFFIILIFGTIGYKYFGGTNWSFLDAAYMTVITISTVGYGETHDLENNTAARIFTMLFLLFGMGVLLYSLGIVTTFFIEANPFDTLGRYFMKKKIEKAKHHTIVCGISKTGVHILKELISTNRSFVIIEENQEVIDKFVNDSICKNSEILYICGDATDDNILENAGIKKASSICLALPNDKDNLFITITAKQINSKIRIVAKSTEEKNRSKMKKAGADSIISPNFIGGLRMVSEAIRPSVTTFLDIMLRDKHNLRIEEVILYPGSILINKKLKETNIHEELGLLIIALKKDLADDFSYNPASNTELNIKDTIITIGNPDQIASLRKLANMDS